MGLNSAIEIEVVYKAQYCLPCFYMDRAVKDTLPRYGSDLVYHRVDLQTEPGRKRFIDLSISLFGKEGVFTHKRIAPIPSLFINNELFFDAIPPRYELEEAIDEVLGRR
ncbi:MAG: hypothetical protein MI747_09770 [Desulfobacterales bacterium]|nr:hypothetical protein [Desulfobacterales bacterium]